MNHVIYFQSNVILFNINDHIFVAYKYFLIVQILNLIKMENTILTLAIIIFIAEAISTSYGQESDNLSIITRRDNLQEIQKNMVDVNQNLNGSQDNSFSEYQKFMKDAEIRINGNEKVFAEFKEKLLKINHMDKTTSQKMVNMFEQENKDLKNKLVTYKRDQEQGKWKSFKRAFNHNLNVLEIQMWSMK